MLASMDVYTFVIETFGEARTFDRTSIVNADGRRNGLLHIVLFDPPD